MSLIYGKVPSLDARASIPVHMSTHTSTPHTHAHSYTTPHQHVTHTKYTHTKYTYTQNTHIHTQTQELLDSVNENSMEKEKS